MSHARDVGLDAERRVLVDDRDLVHAHGHVAVHGVLGDRREGLVERRGLVAAADLEERAEARVLGLLVRARRRLELRDRPVLVREPERRDRLCWRCRGRDGAMTNTPARVRLRKDDDDRLETSSGSRQPVDVRPRPRAPQRSIDSRGVRAAAAKRTHEAKRSIECCTKTRAERARVG